MQCRQIACLQEALAGRAAFGVSDQKKHFLQRTPYKSGFQFQLFARQLRNALPGLCMYDKEIGQTRAVGMKTVFRNNAQRLNFTTGTAGFFPNFPQYCSNFIFTFFYCAAGQALRKIFPCIHCNA